MCSWSLKEQRNCHKAAVNLAEALHVKLPIAEIIPERMQRGQVRAYLLTLLEVVKEAFEFLGRYAKTSFLRTLQ